MEVEYTALRMALRAAIPLIEVIRFRDQSEALLRLVNMRSRGRLKVGAVLE
jgi:hypothetical protein